MKEQLDRFSSFDPKELSCGGGGQVDRLCVNPECGQHSPMCSRTDCPSCGDKSVHRGCKHIMLARVTQLLEERSGRHCRFLGSLVEIEDAAIRRLVSSRAELARTHYLGGLEEKHLSTVEEIYRQKNPHCLVGAEAKEFYERLRQEAGLSEDSRATGFMDLFRDEARSLGSRLQGRREKYLQWLLNEEEPGARLKMCPKEWSISLQEEAAEYRSMSRKEKEGKLALRPEVYD